MKFFCVGLGQVGLSLKIIMHKGCLVVLPIPSAHANASIMSIYITKSRTIYRAEVTAACHRENEARLRKLMEGKQKCMRILSEEYGQKDYFSLTTPSQVRKYFATKLSMLPIAGNFSHDLRFRRTGWLCRCGAREEEEHIRSHCQLYEDIREKYGELDDDDKLVAFFGEVLLRRDDMDEKEKEEKRSRRRKEQEE